MEKKMYRKLLNAAKWCFLHVCSVRLTLDAKTEMSNLTRACVLACLAWGWDVKAVPLAQILGAC